MVVLEPDDAAGRPRGVDRVGDDQAVAVGDEVEPLHARGAAVERLDFARQRVRGVQRLDDCTPTPSSNIRMLPRPRTSTLAFEASITSP